MPMAMIEGSEQLAKAKLAKGKGHGSSSSVTRRKLPRVLLAESHRTC